VDSTITVSRGMCFGHGGADWQWASIVIFLLTLLTFWVLMKLRYFLWSRFLFLEGLCFRRTVSVFLNVSPCDTVVCGHNQLCRKNLTSQFLSVTPHPENEALEFTKCCYYSTRLSYAVLYYNVLHYTTLYYTTLSQIQHYFHFPSLKSHTCQKLYLFWSKFRCQVVVSSDEGVGLLCVTWGTIDTEIRRK
jgi:hypothetical protein